jgi:hypothetical protein
VAPFRWPRHVQLWKRFLAAHGKARSVPRVDNIAFRVGARGQQGSPRRSSRGPRRSSRGKCQTAMVMHAWYCDKRRTGTNIAPLMKKGKHSKAEIAAKLAQADDLATQGRLQSEIARTLGVSVMTLPRWRKIPPATQGTPAGANDPSHFDQAPITELQLENSRGAWSPICSSRHRPTGLASPAQADRQDWTLYEDGRPIGRIYEDASASTPPELRWFWSIIEVVRVPGVVTPRAAVRRSQGHVPRQLDESKSGRLTTDAFQDHRTRCGHRESRPGSSVNKPAAPGWQPLFATPARHQLAFGRRRQ